MAIFKYELRQLRGLVMAWLVALPALLFGMLPTFLTMLRSADGSVKPDMLEAVEQNSFLKAVDMSADFLARPIGMYGFLTGWFFGLAVAVVSLHIGLSTQTKEYTGRTADFLLTKPCSRARVYSQKLLASSAAVLSIGLMYYIASFAALALFLGDGLDVRLFSLLAGSVTLNAFLYMSFGVLLGVAAPRIRKPLFASVTAVFITVMVGQVGVVTGTDALLFLSPPKFFGGSVIASLGHYDMRFVAWLVFLVVAFVLSGLAIFRKKDVYVAA